MAKKKKEVIKEEVNTTEITKEVIEFVEEKPVKKETKKENKRKINLYDIYDGKENITIKVRNITKKDDKDLFDIKICDDKKLLGTYLLYEKDLLSKIKEIDGKLRG